MICVQAMTNENKGILKTGTTTVGVRTKECVVLAADQKATMGYFVAETDTKKVFKLTDRIAITMAGGVGDAQTLVRFLRSQAKLFEIERETAITTKALVTFLSNILSNSRFYPFMIQFIVGGYTNGTAAMYNMDMAGGVSDVNDYTVTGSGSEFAMGVLDNQYKVSMRREEAIKLAIAAVNAGRKRDAASGGDSVTVLVIDDKGIMEMDRKDVDKILAAM